jgi:hypothetical protein
VNFRRPIPHLRDHHAPYLGVWKIEGSPLRINEEIFIWEGIAAAYSSYKITLNPSLDESHEVLAALLRISMGQIKEVLEDDHGFQHLSRPKRDTLLRIWSQIPLEVEFRLDDP